MFVTFGLSTVSLDIMDKSHWMVQALFSSRMLLDIFAVYFATSLQTHNCSAKQCLLLPLVVEKGTSLQKKQRRTLTILIVICRQMHHVLPCDY
jgi:hypothetical protein